MNIAPLYNWALTVKATSANSQIAAFGGVAQRIVDDYLSGKEPWLQARNEFLRTVDDAFINAAEQAWADGGRDLADIPVGPLTQMLSEQRGFARDAWDRLQEQFRAAQLAGEDTTQPGAGFGDRWAAGLWGEYNHFAMLAKAGTRKTLYQWILGNTEKHCDTCLMLAQGEAHTMDWYLNRDYIPGKNGCALDCGGYNCDCTLADVAGHDVTLTAISEAD